MYPNLWWRYQFLIQTEIYMHTHTHTHTYIYIMAAYIYIFRFLLQSWGVPMGIMVKVLDFDLKVNKLKLQFCYYVHFQTNTLEKDTGWNDKIVSPRKDNMIPFPFNENRFSFFVADHLLVGQLCTNPKSNRSLLSCLKVAQCSTSEIRNVQLYNSCSLPIQVMTTGPLPAPSKCKWGLPWITCPGWWKQSFWLWLWSLVWFQVRATSCHLTSSKSAWKSTPKCTWMCWRVWWSSGAIRWPVADAGCGSRTWCQPTSPKRPRLGFKRRATTLYPSLTEPPSSPDINPLDYFVW